MPVNVDADEEESRATRTLRKSGNSVVVSLPPSLLEQAGMKLGDDVKVATGFEGDEIRIERLPDEPKAETTN